VEEKETFEKLTCRVRELEEEVVNISSLQDQLRIAKLVLEEHDHQMEEQFIKANAFIMETELARIELNQVFNTTSDGMWIVDDQFSVIRINHTLASLLGVSDTDAVKSKCYELFDGSLCRTDNCPMTMVLKGKKETECDIERRADNAPNLFILTATPFRGLDGGVIGIIECFKDITERKKIETELQHANQELQRLTTIDGLTQIANRRCFDDYLQKEWKRLTREKLPLSLIMCDVDYFKLYNDNYGHQSGDDCLRAVAKAIENCANRPADLAARYGGEEFTVILPNTGAEGAVHIAECIRTQIQDLMIVHAFSQVHDYVTLSLGIASIIPEYNGNPQLLVEASDSALCEAKRSGRNRYFLKNLIAPQ
jgi:diguanylate cyclase (GGDEF)-like protein/PAS domain S-box-containing protein